MGVSPMNPGLAKLFGLDATQTCLLSVIYNDQVFCDFKSIYVCDSTSFPDPVFVNVAVRRGRGGRGGGGVEKERQRQR